VPLRARGARVSRDGVLIIDACEKRVQSRAPQGSAKARARCEVQPATPAAKGGALMPRVMPLRVRAAEEV